jgi:hypothetical protein
VVATNTLIAGRLPFSAEKFSFPGVLPIIVR